MDLCARAHPRFATRRAPLGGPARRGLYRLTREHGNHRLPRLRPCDAHGLRTLSALRVRQGGATGRGHVLTLVAGVLLFVLGIELIVVAAVVALLVLLALGLAALV